MDSMGENSHSNLSFNSLKLCNSESVSVNRFAMVTTGKEVATILCLKSLER